MATRRKPSPTRKASTTARATRREKATTPPPDTAPIVDPEPTGPPVEPVAPEPVAGPVTDPAPNNTARENDTPIVEQEPHFTMSTFADRARAREKRLRQDERVAASEKK